MLNVEQEFFLIGSSNKTTTVLERVIIGRANINMQSKQILLK